jgi:tol-pal system protein YbgF
MQYQINTLRAEVKKITRKSKSIETQFPGQQKQFNKKIQELEEAQQVAAKTVSDLLIRIQYLTTEVQMLTGRLEEARYHSEKNSAELKENKEMLSAKMKQLDIMVEDLKKRLAGPTPVAAPKEEPKKTKAAAEHKDDNKGKEDDLEKEKTDVKDAYMAAYEAYKEARTVEAREKFKALLMDYSENEYSDNARFWIAESYYKDGNYEDAILAYEELFKKNPDSDKVSGAMLKQGLAFYALKDSKTGRIILERLVDKFPESDQAKLAIKKMKKASVSPKKK